MYSQLFLKMNGNHGPKNVESFQKFWTLLFHVKVKKIRPVDIIKCSVLGLLGLSTEYELICVTCYFPTVCPGTMILDSLSVGSWKLSFNCVIDSVYINWKHDGKIRSELKLYERIWSRNFSIPEHFSYTCILCIHTKADNNDISVQRRPDS